MAHSAMSSSGLPELRINPGDVRGSWDDFITQFEIDLEWRVAASGTKKGTDSSGGAADVPAFDDKLKALALIRAGGREGQRVLEAKGRKLTGGSLTYKCARDVLNDHYGREESINVRTRNFF